MTLFNKRAGNIALSAHAADITVCVFVFVSVDGNVTRTEFTSHWNIRQLGPEEEGQTLFTNLDVNNDHQIDEHIDLPHIIRFFDRDGKTNRMSTKKIPTL